MRIHNKSTKSRRGVAVMEFTFSLMFLIPLLTGILVSGLVDPQPRDESSLRLKWRLRGVDSKRGAPDDWAKLASNLI
jgi:hypothetical protein